ncbi:DNA polymerase III subunit beta [Aurantimonas sp. MSK8Z-1]|uniref:DNA polymerase III subunit beta n=1 Tax=Mangrovibrevibacter kandeliae TaxID=2968473 RepID=UPI002117B8EA|nr:DNA polymerase III subunit beta [Aurantimonas sp. MSK8Z-1]MCW4114780.1 DNA polymerase III subunit beta [Aurantimonas sp. MSK8Z-1]
MPLDLSVPHATLRPLVEAAGRVVERRNTIPILSHGLLTAAADGSLTVTATDLDMQVEARAPAGSATVAGAGTLALPAGLLADILKKTGGEIVLREGDNGRQRLTAGRARFDLATLPAEDFPSLQPVDAGAVRFEIAAGSLAAMLAAVAFAQSTEETRYYLNGVFLECSPGAPASETQSKLKGGADDPAPASETQSKLKGGADDPASASETQSKLRGGADDPASASETQSKLRGGADDPAPASETQSKLRGAAYDPAPASETQSKLKGGANGRLLAVATDGHRLARIATAVAVPALPPVILPRKTVTEILRLAGVAAPDAPIAVGLTERAIRFETPQLTLTSKLIDGTFPDYRRVIPADNPRRTVLERAALAQAVERVATVSTERGRAVKLTFGEGELRLEVESPDTGAASETLACDWTGEPLTIGFNGRYLAEVLSTLSAETIELALKDPASPALITIPGDDSRLIVLMPMRV